MTAAGVTTTLPFSGSYSDSVILAEGYQMQKGESLISPGQVEASDGYFEAMGATLRRRAVLQCATTWRSAHRC